MLDMVVVPCKWNFLKIIKKDIVLVAEPIPLEPVYGPSRI